MTESAAKPAYDAARQAHELSRAVRRLRVSRGWSQIELAKAAAMSQSTVARLEGGAVPNLPMLKRLATALDAELVVRIVPRADDGGEVA
ncbi:MAG: helix-turn-helix domain-containing protein [Jatrophihabitans sp.]